MNTVLEDSARHYMWKRLGIYNKIGRIEYVRTIGLKNPCDLKPSAEDYEQAKQNPKGDPNSMSSCGTTQCCDYDLSQPVTLTSCTTPTYVNWVMKTPPRSLAPSTPTSAPCKPETKRKNMYDDFETPVQTRTDETRKRDYLSSRLEDAECAQDDTLRKMFFIDDDVRPRSANELLERIASGKYLIAKDKGDRNTWSPMDFIQWRDPAKPADAKGYQAATAALATAKVKVADMIRIAEPAEALKALQAFEAWMPTGVAN